TLTTPGAIEALGDLASDRDLAACLIGAGTVLDESAAREVIDAGARFVVSPTLTPAVIRVCRDRDIPCMPGAFTPTEIVEAWRAGSAGGSRKRGRSSRETRCEGCGRPTRGHVRRAAAAAEPAG